MHSIYPSDSHYKMPKILEDSLGNLEYLLLGLTFLGVLYLVMKQANLSVSLSKDPFIGNHGIRFLTETTGTTGPQSSPSMRGYEGMSLSGYEAPVWHAAAHDPSELDMVAFEQAASEVDYNNADARRNFGPNDAVSKYKTQFTMNTEGMGGYSRKAVESMDNKLTSAMLGGNAGLQ